MFASLIGTSVEWYDFYICGTASGLVFPTLFFPKSDPFAATLASFGIFWFGFLGRPIGGAIFGQLGDQIGRRTMLVFTISIMGVATFLIGLLPTYQQIGLWAAILLVLLRLCQGIAVGGEWGGAVLMATEHAPPRRKGLFGASPGMGGPIGGVLANGTFAVLAASYSVAGTLSPEFLAFGWRIPFLLSAGLVGIGLAVRLSVAESPAFEHLKRDAAIARAPVRTVLSNQWKSVLLAGGAFFVANVGYLFGTQFISYAAGPHSILKLPASVILNAIFVSQVASLITIPLAAWLSDYLGRRLVCLTGAWLHFAFAFPFYLLANTKDPHLISLAEFLVGVAFGVLYGPLPAMFAEMFGANVRYSGASLGYQGAAVFAGGLAPTIGTVLLRLSGGGSWALSFYVMAAATISLIAIYLIPETKHVDLTEPVASLGRS